MQDRHNHNEVRCKLMEEIDCDTKLAGELRTCCVCINHDCEEAKIEIAKNKNLET